MLADDPVLRLEEFDNAEFQVDVRSHLFFRCFFKGGYEPELARVCAAHLDSRRDAVDVGANVGFYTVLMARRLAGRRILAVEPAPSAVERLRSNLKRNGIADRVIVFEGALSERRGSATLRLVEGLEEYGTLGSDFQLPIGGEGRAMALRVEAAPLDELVDLYGLAPGFVKIDVEGFEHHVLAGMERVLREQRPVVLLEVSRHLLEANGSSVSEVLELLRGAGYQLLEAHHQELSAEQWFRRHGVGEVLAVPTGSR
jgi:FkbM family methyltransferase